MKQIVKSVLMLAAMLMLAANASAAGIPDFEVGKWSYNILSEEEKTVEVNTYRNGMADLVGHVAIPGNVTYGGTVYTVTSIGESAFFNCRKITSVDIPESVTSIGEKAFYYCSELSSIILPDNVTSICRHAFAMCTGLTSINLPEGLTSISEHVFDGCSSLTSIKIPYSVTSIGEYAFSNCSGLTSVELPDGLVSIGNDAFYYCIYNHRTTKTNQKYPSVNL